MVQSGSHSRRKNGKGIIAGIKKSRRVRSRGISAQQGDPVTPSPALSEALSKILQTRGKEYISSDPVELVHMYGSRNDIEAAGFIAASFAFGNVSQIRSFLSRLFAALGPSPHGAITGPVPVSRGRIEGLRHRFISTAGVVRFLGCMRHAYNDHGSLENMFIKGMPPGEDTRLSLAGFLERFRKSWGKGLQRQRDFLFPDPMRGSACKRHNLFLRWMARSADGIDFGIWNAVSPRDLIVPLDTHMIRMGRLLGLTGRTTPGWKMAEEITNGLRAICPDDPVKYDFPLTRLGILKECRPGRPGDCGMCTLTKICALNRIRAGKTK